MNILKRHISSAERFASLLLPTALLLWGCGSPKPEMLEAPVQTETAPAEHAGTERTEETEMKTDTLVMYIDDQPVSVDWEDNSSVTALKELVGRDDILIAMSRYGGFEQVGPIGSRLPDEDTQLTTQAGDIVLYSGNQIVLFYGSNSWAYTRLGTIRDLSVEQLRSILGDHDVSVRLSAD